ncbi:predicted protein [Sclerotinia sclerotiorum 1980 UF-70]|uniref:Uncharacterized protein n=1 Tax=Sclerotinia sclerotiorum (strain ATCC 18683 / 1980 / Ss-1) TaxID=665079 RepID=A7EP20_SCLS1|nr:predicted protein [Sclerotinia sclerotiorum 1980 UF-70]EDO04586.1 predicted protein [Sclerotinia sclerotiorum 1980 UF-70]
MEIRLAKDGEKRRERLIVECYVDYLDIILYLLSCFGLLWCGLIFWHNDHMNIPCSVDNLAPELMLGRSFAYGIC